MANEKFTHTMKDLCDELDKRIAQLEQFQGKLQSKINNNISKTKNGDALGRVTNSLTYAKQARSAMESSCCNYSCQYELEDQ